MRQSKYKVWDNQEKSFINRVEYQIAILNTVEAEENYEEFIHQPFRDNCGDRFIPLQDTGLKDKNGVEIYEGDILKINNGTTFYLVEWSDGGFRYAKDRMHKLPCNAIDPEVIGNIHQDSHLLDNP